MLKSVKLNLFSIKMLPTIERFALMVVGTMVSFAAGFWVGRSFGQPGDVSPTGEPLVEHESLVSNPEEQIPRSFSEHSLALP